MSKRNRKYLKYIYLDIFKIKIMQQTNSASNIAAAADSHAAATSDDLNHSNSNQDFAAAGDNHSSIKERLGNPKITFVLGKFSNPQLNTLLTTYIYNCYL
jgi:hypothetical protein